MKATEDLNFMEENGVIKFVHLFKTYYLGISFIGIIAFVIQEIPYIIMPLIKPTSNPIMNMQNEIQWIEKVQGLVGMLSMFLLMLIVRDDIKFFSISTTKEKTFFALTIGMILINLIVSNIFRKINFSRSVAGS